MHALTLYLSHPAESQRTIPEKRAASDACLRRIGLSLPVIRDEGDQTHRVSKLVRTKEFLSTHAAVVVVVDDDDGRVTKDDETTYARSVKSLTIHTLLLNPWTFDRRSPCVRTWNCWRVSD